VWGVGFYPFSGGQLPNFQGKNPIAKIALSSQNNEAVILSPNNARIECRRRPRKRQSLTSKPEKSTIADLTTTATICYNDLLSTI